MENKTYLVVTAAPNSENMAELAHYQEASAPIMKKHGAIFPPIKANFSEVLVGDSQAKFLILLEFPAKENIQAVFSDPEYIALTHDRDKGLKALNIAIAEA